MERYRDKGEETGKEITYDERIWRGWDKPGGILMQASDGVSSSQFRFS
jgi:hypothetical protein